MMKAGLNAEIGAMLRRQRELLKITREELCRRTDLSPQFLAEVEKGLKSVSPEVLRKLCLGLGLPGGYILWGLRNPKEVKALARVLSRLAPRLYRWLKKRF